MSSIDHLNRSNDAPSVTAVRRHFGSLSNTYALIGHPLSDRALGSKGSQQVRNALICFKEKLIEDLDSISCSIVRSLGRTYLLIDEVFVLRIAVLSARQGRGTFKQWQLFTTVKNEHDAVIVARMNACNEKLLTDHFHLFPNASGERKTIGINVKRDAKTTISARGFEISCCEPIAEIAKLKKCGQRIPSAMTDFKNLLAGCRRISNGILGKTAKDGGWR